MAVNHTKERDVLDDAKTFYAAANRNRGTFGELIVAPRQTSIALQFQYGLSSYDVTSADSGTGASTYDDHRLVLSSGTGVGTAETRSVKTVRYEPGSEGFGIFTAAFTKGETNTTQWAGLFDSDDGMMLGYFGDAFAIGYRKDTSQSVVTRANFNGEDISWLDPEMMSPYMVRYGWLGVANLTWWVFNPYTRNWTLMHTEVFSNQQKTVHIGNPSMPICFESKRTTGTGSDLKIHTASWRGGITKFGVESGRSFSEDNTKAGVTTTLTNLFTIRAKDTYLTKTNKVEDKMKFLSAFSDGTKAAEICIVKNATLGGTPAYNDVDATNSTIDFDIAGTTVTGGAVVFRAYLDKVDAKEFDLTNYNISIYPGDTLTVAGRATASTTDMGATLVWDELF